MLKITNENLNEKLTVAQYKAAKKVAEIEKTTLTMYIDPDGGDVVIIKDFSYEDITIYRIKDNGKVYEDIGFFQGWASTWIGDHTAIVQTDHD